MTHGGALTVQDRPGGVRAWLLLLASIGCGHTEPFSTTPPGADQPFDVGPPARLTLNQGPDRGAAWLPDGSGIVYSTQQLGRRDRDVCLALIPPTGGTQRQLTCDLTPTSIDSNDAIESPSPTADRRLAFVSRSSRINAITPNSGSIDLGFLGNPSSRTPLQPLPYTIPGGQPHNGASQLRWLSSDRLIYLGERLDYRLRCERCVEWDTMTTGLEAMSIDVSQPGSSPQPIPGTSNASGIAVGAGADEVYYTLAGDARVYRQSLSTGAVAVAYDFGAAGIARDVHVVGNRLAAVVGGRITYGISPAFGPTVWDSGGVLHLVDFEAGTDVLLEGPGLFRRPQISPSGSALVVEVYPLIITGPPIATDTTVSRNGDLYLFGVP